MPEETKQTGVPENAVPVNLADLKTSYSNVCRITQTPNELFLDFGLNPIPPEPLKLENRIVLSYDGAKRLLLYLNNAIQAYESQYGVIELDMAKRQKK